MDKYEILALVVIAVFAVPVLYLVYFVGRIIVAAVSDHKNRDQMKQDGEAFEQMVEAVKSIPLADAKARAEAPLTQSIPQSISDASEQQANSHLMTPSEEDRYRLLKRTHQQLLLDWKRQKGPCIICGELAGTDRDHLPPKVLFPTAIRNPQTEFFTFPVCKQCNNSSSDEDFLFSVALSFWLNQDSILAGQEPTDPELLALYQQAMGHFNDPTKGDHRTRLLRPFVNEQPSTGRLVVNLNALPVNQTLTKIAKAIYWLNTGGDVLQRHNPGWWIRRAVDTSKPHFIENHLKTSNAELHWGGRFISHFTIGHPKDGVGGFISASLHFYTNRNIGRGMSWVAFGSPEATSANGRSLYDLATSFWGEATIKPSNWIRSVPRRE